MLSPRQNAVHHPGRYSLFDAFVPQELRKIPLNRFGSEESSPGRFLISDSPQAQAWTPESQACLLLIIIQVKKDNITTVLP